MTTTAQVMLGVRTGYSTDTTCKIVVASLADGDVVITGSFATVTITAANMVAIGAGFTGSATISGLSAFTRYNYTATQGTKVTSGSFMTAPGVSNDFSLFFASCDSHKLTGNGGNVTGFWDKVHAYAVSGALPTAGVMFVDDHGYVDRCTVDDTAGTGLKVTDTTNGAEYNANVADYALGYMAFLGMLGDTSQDAVAWGRDADRVWCNQNLNYLPQWGDHEFTNDFGFNYNNTTATAIPGLAAGITGVNVWTAGKAAWDAFFYPLMPTPLAGGYGWVMPMGCVNLIAPDGITNARGSWDVSSKLPSDATATGGQIGTLFGNTQIDAILSYVAANPQPFNLLGMAHSIRYLEAYTSPSVNGVFLHGAQHPVYDHVLAEYQRMFTATGNTPKSLMDNSATNGISGVTVMLHGDYHHACVQRNEKAAYTGNAKENMWSVYLGTINGSTNFTMPVTAGSSYGGTTLEYDSGWMSSPGANHQYAGIRIDVYGSKAKPEMHIYLMDSAGGIMWSGKWYSKSGNTAMPSTNKLPSLVGTSSKAQA